MIASPALGLSHLINGISDTYEVGAPAIRAPVSYVYLEHFIRVTRLERSKHMDQQYRHSKLHT